MQEAWLLFNEQAIRQAAGNPNGKEKLNLPPLKSLEKLPDPKETLHQTLRDACGLSGRRLKKFSTHQAAHHVANYIDDFTPLLQLSAFQQLEQDVVELAKRLFPDS